MLGNNPSKADEIAHYRAFIDSLPHGSYLYAMFANSLHIVEGEIMNDFAYDPLPELRKRQMDATNELAETKKQHLALQEKVNSLQGQVRSLESDKTYLSSEVEAIRRQARRIAGL